MFTLEILFSKHLHLLLATTCIQYVEIFPVEAETYAFKRAYLCLNQQL